MFSVWLVFRSWCLDSEYQLILILAKVHKFLNVLQKSWLEMKKNVNFSLAMFMLLKLFFLWLWLQVSNCHMLKFLLNIIKQFFLCPAFRKRVKRYEWMWKAFEMKFFNTSNTSNFDELWNQWLKLLTGLQNNWSVLIFLENSVFGRQNLISSMKQVNLHQKAITV